jgi:hypothetical protein
MKDCIAFMWREEQCNKLGHTGNGVCRIDVGEEGGVWPSECGEAVGVADYTGWEVGIEG